MSDGNILEVFKGNPPSVKIYSPNQQLLDTILLDEAAGLRKTSTGKKFLRELTKGGAIDQTRKVDYNTVLGPGEYRYARSSNTLYVVNNLPEHEHTLLVVNLTTRKVDASLPIASGDIVKLFLSNEAKRLLCYTAGKFQSIDNLHSTDLEDLKPPLDPSITVINTESNSVVTTYKWLEQFRESAERKLKRGLFSTHIIGSGGDGVTLVQSNLVSGDKKAEEIVVFREPSVNPVMTVDSEGVIAGAILSKDKRRLLVAVLGDKHSAAKLLKLDLESKTVSNAQLSDNPSRFVRLGETEDAWIVGDREMRKITEDGTPCDAVIPLNKFAAGGDEVSSVFLDGLPGETINVGEDYAGILIVKRNGDSYHKLALINLKDRKVEAVVQTLSPAAQIRIKTERTLLALALTAASGAGAAGGAPGYNVFIPNLRLGNVALASDDKGHLFALDNQAHEVTVLNAQTAAVTSRFKVDPSVSRIRIFKNGSQLICYGKEIYNFDLNAITATAKESDLDRIDDSK